MFVFECAVLMFGHQNKIFACFVCFLFFVFFPALPCCPLSHARLLSFDELYN